MFGGVIPPEPPITPTAGGVGVDVDMEGEQRKRLLRDDEDLIIILSSWMTNKN